MVKVLLTKQSNYPVDSSEIKRKLSVFFEKQGVVSDAEVSVVLVGEQKMLNLGKLYLKDDNLHNVLSFLPEETKEHFVFPPDGKIYLGEIVVCYPKAVSEAKKENVLISERVYDLIEHGALHLMGIHHEE